MTAESSRFLLNLQIAAHRLEKHANRKLENSAGISMRQGAVLRAIAEGYGTSQSEIAESLGLNESAVTAMVPRLIRSGLITRERSSSDGRVKKLVLTQDGMNALAEALGAFMPIYRLLDETVGDHIDDLSDAIERLNDRLSADQP